MSLYLLVCIRFSLYGNLSLDKKLENKYMQTDRVQIIYRGMLLSLQVMGCQKNKYGKF